MLTPEQIAAARQKYSITPVADASAPAVDHAQNLTDAWAAADSGKADTQSVFMTPLQRIAAGKGKDNLEVTKGAVKQAVRDFSSAGAQNAGPIGKAMMDNAPGFKKSIEALDTATQPKGVLQKTGAAQTTLAETAIPGPKAVVKGVDMAKTALATKAEKGLVDALTPTLTPTRKLKGIVGAAKNGEVFDQAVEKTTQNSVAALKDVATTLGKKPTDFIKTGAAKAQQNAAGLGKAIGEYSKKVVTPFLKESGVNYNFADLKKSLELVKPSESLDTAALSAYNKVRSRVLAAIANHVGPEVKNIKSVGAMRQAAGEAGQVPAKTMQGDIDFWNARKIIDQIVEEETKGKAFGDASLTGAKAAYKDLRNGFAQYLGEAFRYPGQMDKVNKANEFLKTDRVAQMDKTGWNLDQFEHQFGLVRNAADESRAAEWEKHMANMSSLYDGISSIGTKAVKEYGKSKMTLWMVEHPAMAEMLKHGLFWGAGGAAATIGAKAVGL